MLLDYGSYKECEVLDLINGDLVLLKNGLIARFEDVGCAVVGAFELVKFGYVELEDSKVQIRARDGRAIDHTTMAPFSFEDVYDVIAILERAEKVEEQPEQESNLIDKMLSEHRNGINRAPIKRYIAFAGRIGISEGGWDDVICTSDVYEDVLKKATLIWRLDTSNIWFQIVDTYANRKLAWAKGNEITGAVL